jgi:flagellar biosynthesis protein FlhG
VLVPAPRVAPELPAQVTGAELKRIREGRGIPLREIALASKIGLRFLEYIEEERVAMLPAPVYLRGFLMEYARALGLDPRRTAEAYMANLPPKRP